MVIVCENDIYLFIYFTNGEFALSSASLSSIFFKITLLAGHTIVKLRESLMHVILDVGSIKRLHAFLEYLPKR